MSNLAFQISGEDLQLLDHEDFDLVWSALGLVIRARYPWVGEPAAVAATYLDPDGTLTLELEDGTAVTAALEVEVGTDAAPVEQAEPREPKNRPAAKAKPVEGEPRPTRGGKRGPMSEAHKAAIAAGRQRGKPVATTPAAGPAVLGDAPVDFMDRARKAAGRTWDERVNGAEA